MDILELRIKQEMMLIAHTNGCHKLEALLDRQIKEVIKNAKQCDW